MKLDPMIEVRVLFFAMLRERIGKKEVQVILEKGAVVQDLKKILINMYPFLETMMDHIIFSVNHEFAFDDHTLANEDEVAIFPPVSGGDGIEPPTYFEITKTEIDLNKILLRISLPSTGAVCMFTGLVRAYTQRNGNRKTRYLEYEAYESMAQQKMKQVASEIRGKWSQVEGIAIVQRIGHLYPGTPTVLIACSAAHRDTGVFEAARYGIDRLKEIVPIWKKEIGSSGEYWIEGGYLPGRDD